MTAIAAAFSDLATMASSRRDSIQRAAEVAEIEIKEGGRKRTKVHQNGIGIISVELQFYPKRGMLLRWGFHCFFLNCIIMNVVCSSSFFLEVYGKDF